MKRIFALFLMIPALALAEQPQSAPDWGDVLKVNQGVTLAGNSMPRPDPEEPPQPPPTDPAPAPDIDIDIDNKAEGGDGGDGGDGGAGGQGGGGGSTGPITNTVGGSSLVNKHQRSAASAHAPTVISNQKCKISQSGAVQLLKFGISLGHDKPSDPKKDDSCLYELYDKLMALQMYKPACMVLMSTRSAGHSKINKSEEPDFKPCEGVTGPPAVAPAPPQVTVIVLSADGNVDEKLDRMFKTIMSSSPK